MEKISTYKWGIDKQPNTTLIQSISKELNIDNTLSILLAQRKIDTYQKAKSFFRPSLEQLYDPFLMKGMTSAVNRILKAIAENETIMLLSDYDVDGITSNTILYTFLKRLSKNIIPYIPDRNKEGYGVSPQSIDFASENRVNLIITLDCGIKSVELIKKANDRSIEVIICDHHTLGYEIPMAQAILNPKQDDCNYPFKDLCGCGIAFKLIQGICIFKSFPKNWYLDYLDFVCVATSADIVPIIDENRIICHYGLKKLATSPNIGLKVLIRQNKIQNISDIVFKIAPIINASGRISHALEIFHLLIETNLEIAIKKATRFLELNQLRRDIENANLQEALSILDKKENHKNAFANIVKKDDWHKGVIGIVASKIIEYFYKPTIVFTYSNGYYVGSARSIREFNLYQALEHCSQYISKYGGHKYAAGVSIKPENFSAFKEQFENEVKISLDKESLIPKLYANAKIRFSEISPKFVRILKQFSPFGPENMTPLFYSEQLIVADNPKVVGANKEHLKGVVKEVDNNICFPFIGFNMAHLIDSLTSRTVFKAIYSIEENDWQDIKTTQLKLRAISF